MRICKTENCEGPIRGQGYCDKHYQYHKYHGNLIITKQRTDCIVKGCRNKHFGLGYCQLHYNRNKVGTLLTAPKHYQGNTGCYIKYCRSKHYANKMCKMHYNRIIRGVDLYTRKNYRDKKYSTLVTLECNTCNVKYTVYPCKAKKRKYCCLNCMYEGQRIKHPTTFIKPIIFKS